MSEWKRIVPALAITALALATAPAAAGDPDPIFEDPFGRSAASIFPDPLGFDVD